DQSALALSAQRGWALFTGKARCEACHSGFNFTDEGYHNLGVGMDREHPDVGRYTVTQLVGLPLLRYLAPSQSLAVFDSFFRVGSLVFGGGHVVLPLIQAEVVPPGWITNEQFIAGYGAAQAVPGPLFTFAAYLGAVMHPWPNGWAGAALALGAIFFPSFLLIVGGLPLWNRLRAQASFQ